MARLTSGDELRKRLEELNKGDVTSATDADGTEACQSSAA
jgi:hypothetical protein